MNLNIEFNPGGHSHVSIASIFNQIYDRIDLEYPEVNKTFVNVNEAFIDPIGGQANRAGCHSLHIVNPENNKIVILSFWDRGEEFAWNMPNWHGTNIVHIIGGLGIKYTPDEFERYYKIKFTPFIYPLFDPLSYELVDKYRKPYIYSEKIKKACFIGTLYNNRGLYANMLKDHPLVDIIDQEQGYRRDAYYEKMSEYAITLSFNGNGEYCVRDFESMGLGIPIVRSEVLTPLIGGLRPYMNYIPASPPCLNASFRFLPPDYETLTQFFVKTIESSLRDEDLLNRISKNNLEYYNEYLLVDKIVNNFFKHFDLDILR